ncbi:ABC transporter substrate-binding protein [Paenibacillus agricola]|uniref:ABC transporter substrate-binding protein n=1 Tax=Paenibacillus agricola TaxID=2716264 RepID=A0ABX0JA88_9BACL|nr:ABC transporter substrate-binding protein [Paenibacillus agricola]NHN31782.1 ABC transporter substrate-binding protein [Paenibacillus agricola]
MYTTKHKHKSHRSALSLISFAALAAMMLVVQACGQTTAPPSASPSPAAASPAPTSAAAPAAGSSDKAAAPAPAASVKVPEVLNYSFVGTTGKQTGAEGWGFHTGIIPKVLAEYGIKTVNAIGGGTGPDINEAILAGRVDVGSMGDTPALLSRAAGSKTKLIGFSSTNTESYLIGKKDGPKSVKDLEGKTIAVVKGSLMHRYAVGLIKENKINAKIINMSWLDSYAALARGDIDAFASATYDYTSYKLTQEGYPVLDWAKDHPILLATSTAIASEAYLSKFPDFPKAWAAARNAALKDLMANKDKYYAYVAETTKAPLDVVPILYNIDLISETAVSEDGVKRVEEAKKFLVEEKLAAKDFNLNEWILK